MPTTAAARPDSARPASLSVLAPSDTFAHRHIGPSEAEIAEMLEALGYPTLDAFSDAVVPAGIRLGRLTNLAGIPDAPRGEHAVLNELRAIASKNKVMKSFIGMGYYDTITPPVILRNIMENPGWYTQYTPYQAEIAQGRLEALINFQTMVSDLTGLPLAGASLLDEATAAAEAISMCDAIHDHTRRRYFVASDCHPQTIGVVQTRAEALGIEIVVGEVDSLRDADLAGYGGVLVQNPATDGVIRDFAPLAAKVHASGGLVVMATDLLACTLITPPGEMGADVAVGSAQRFGVPMGFGGPHAAFIATKTEYNRKMPGRIIGVSRDSHGNTAYRMAIQTREQHIKREKATSNICTAQALLAIMAGMYAVYHGPEGLRRIALRTHAMAQLLLSALRLVDCRGVSEHEFFDTIRVKVMPSYRGTAAKLVAALAARGINVRDYGDETIGFSCDEATTLDDISNIISAIEGGPVGSVDAAALSVGFDESRLMSSPPVGFARQSGYLTHPVFNTHHSEHEMLRYIFKLMGRDLSLAHSMIPLGSCTMKLNATSEMIPVTWPEFGRMHPFAPADQTHGYQKMFADLESWLAEITGFAAVSLQPNSGAQGEYAGLLAIRAYHHSRGHQHRNVCLIPSSAHGTNPASAVIAGFKVVEVECDAKGNIDVADLKAKAAAHKDDLAALMVTYPSTHGVFEESIKDVCRIVHEHGGQVYMDGANMNAQVGLTSPGLIGADVCHLNLHKTFCIPHGGGGPGMGPICVAAHLAPFLAGHPVVSPFSQQPDRKGGPGAHHANGNGTTNAESRMPNAGSANCGPVAAAPFGSPSILTISWMYIAMMGAAGLKRATQVAMLSANYMAKRLSTHYPVLYTAPTGRNAHEFILDCRPFEKSAGIKVDDIAKRLQDYGFHAPTMSFPVPGTLMIEPTESEPKAELDRFIDAMIGIRAEIRAIEEGKMDRADNPLKNAPHTIAAVAADTWTHKYPREQAAFPAPWLRDAKFWPHVGRIDNPYGDRNLMCTCPTVAEMAAN